MSISSRLPVSTTMGKKKRPWEPNLRVVLCVVLRLILHAKQDNPKEIFLSVLVKYFWRQVVTWRGDHVTSVIEIWIPSPNSFITIHTRGNWLRGWWEGREGGRTSGGRFFWPQISFTVRFFCLELTPPPRRGVAWLLRGAKRLYWIFKAVSGEAYRVELVMSILCCWEHGFLKLFIIYYFQKCAPGL